MLASKSLSFDPGRAVLQDYLEGHPARLMVSDFQPMAEALANGVVAPDTRLLAFELDGQLYATPMSIVLAYNVIQGQHQQQPWMMTFCNACNTGMVFNPICDGQLLHFQRRGSYDGLLLIWDAETQSYWQHITGECLYGVSVGKQLATLTVTRQMTAAEANGMTHLNPLLLTSQLTPEQAQLSRLMEKMRDNPTRQEAGIVATIAREDTRRPRFELGLGVLTTEHSLFIPLEVLYAHNSALTTEFEGRPLLVYQLPDAIAPVAAYAKSRRAELERDVLRLDSGVYIQNDLYYTADGRSQVLMRPTQLLMRWYGFALTFPGCDILTS
ncbi:MAG: DUF3179 domain-containing protein [Anaerolineae bacterium]|nr:DUF3179 domain-containing protein [Anaerolineae bacterium]